MSFKKINNDDEHNSIYDVNDLVVETCFHAQIAVICGSTYATGCFGWSLKRSGFTLARPLWDTASQDLTAPEPFYYPSLS